MAMNYSSCSDTTAIPAFLLQTLDPQPMLGGVTGHYYGKAYFLGFDTLSQALAELFAGRYDTHRRQSSVRTERERTAENGG